MRTESVKLLYEKLNQKLSTLNQDGTSRLLPVTIQVSGQ